MSTAIKAGDTVRRTRHEYRGMNVGDLAVVKEVHVSKFATSVELDKYDGKHDAANLEVVTGAAVTPPYYAFPGGVRVHQISGHLTGFGAQALQYIARSTRLDGQNKGDTAENLRKAIRFLELEIARIEGE